MSPAPLPVDATSIERPPEPPDAAVLSVIVLLVMLSGWNCSIAPIVVPLVLPTIELLSIEVVLVAPVPGEKVTSAAPAQASLLDSVLVLIVSFVAAPSV